MQALLYADLSRGSVSETVGGPVFVWPKLTVGEDVTIAFRFVARVNDVAAEVQREVKAFRASIGTDEAKPTDGTVRLYIGDAAAVAGVNVTAEIPFNASAERVKAAINECTGLPNCSVWLRNGSYWVQFTDGEKRSIVAYTNTFFPISFLKVEEWQEAGRWMHKIRFVQAPVAFTDSQERVLPPAPMVQRVRAGGTSDGATWNEVQSIEFPFAFRGTYQLQFGLKKTALLDPTADGPEEVQAALNAIAPEGGAFIVTNPTSNLAHIEFVGDVFAGASHDLLALSVFSAPPGDVTFTMSLNDSPMWALMDGVKQGEEIALPLEIEAELEDPTDEEKSQMVKLVRTTVTLRRPVLWAGLASHPSVDWLRPPTATRYVPFTSSQVTVGMLHRRDVLGDGETSEFVIDHGFDTEELFVIVRENVSGGELLIAGVDYSLEYIDADSIRITALDAVWDGGAVVVTTAALPERPVYQAHTHVIADIEDLQAILDSLSDAVGDLVGLVPTGALTAPAVPKQTAIAQWALPKIAQVLPMRAEVKFSEMKELPEKSLRAGGLLPAIHAEQEETETLPDPLPEVLGGLEPGVLYKNEGAEDVVLSGDLGRRSEIVKPNGYATLVAHGDDRFSWYAVTQSPDEANTWYPVAMERELFMFSVNPRQLRLGTRLELSFGIELAILNSNTRAMYSLVVEFGEYTAEENPDPTGKNLKALVWNNVPILEQVLDLSEVPATHVFGVKISHSMVGGSPTIKASRTFYGAEEAAESAPTSARFALRARLAKFDTEDSQVDPRGLVAVLGLDKKVTTTDEAIEVGTAKILRVI